jgi:SAM-dependent methyltransferase
LEALAGKPVDYVGIDQSERLLELARERHPGYKFEQADVLNLSGIREYDFDYIFAVAVLHHLPGRKLQIDALKQMRSKVKPDGLIIITVWNMWKQKRFRKLILRNSLLKLIGKNKMDLGDVVFDWKNPKGEAVSRRYYHAFTRRSLKKISRKAGLRIESVMSDNYNYYLLARPRAGK